MTDSFRLDAPLIESLLVELSEEIDGAKPLTLRLVGGALLALLGLRESTLDIDVISPLDENLRQAITAVASRHGLPQNWLNDNARAFVPQREGNVGDLVLIDRPGLTVLGLPLRDIFLMKLARASASDRADLKLLWPLVAPQFIGVDDLVQEFYRVFPLEPVDEFLGSFIEEVARPDHDN